MRKRIAAVVTAIVAFAGLGLAAGPAQAADRYGIEINIGNGLCLDIPNNDAHSGQAVQQYYCNGSNAQDWNVIHVGSTYFKIQSNSHRAYCLNNWESTGATGNNIKLYTCDSGGDDFLFNKVGDGTSLYQFFQFQPKAAGANCVNMWGGDQLHAVARLYPCSDNQTNSYFDLWDNN